jgi:hypothetical protein
MSTPEENIKTILADWLDALRRHDFATVERRGSTQTMETYSHMLPGVGDVAATALEEPLTDLLLPYCCQDPSSMIVDSSLFIGFAGKTESRRADSNR